MINALSARSFARRFTVVVTALAVALVGWFFAPDSRSQAPSMTTSNLALTALITRLKAQQDQMAANQTKIEAQTALLAESLRQAKIYSARSGSGHR